MTMSVRFLISHLARLMDQHLGTYRRFSTSHVSGYIDIKTL